MFLSPPGPARGGPALPVSDLALLDLMFSVRAHGCVSKISTIDRISSEPSTPLKGAAHLSLSMSLFGSV